MTIENINIRNLFSLRFLSALLGICSSLIMIYTFGTKNNIEIWFLSSVIFNSFLALSQAGLISELVIPVYTAERETNDKNASDIFSYLINLLMLFSTLFLIIIYFNLSDILLFIFADNVKIDFDKLIKFTEIINLFIPLALLNIILKAILNSHKIFQIPEKIKILRQIITIASIGFFYKYGVVALVYPFIVGIIIEFCILSIYLKKTTFSYSFKIIRKPKLNLIFSFNKNIISTILYVTSNQLFTIYLTSVISGFNIVFYNTYAYVINLFKVLRNTTINSFKTVYLTSFSLNKERFSQIRKEMNLMDFILGSFIIFVAVNSESILLFLWQNKNFTIDSIIRASYILKILSIGYIFDLLLFFMSMKIKIDLKFNKLLLIKSFVQLLSTFIIYIISYNTLTIDKFYFIIAINFLLNSIFLYFGFNSVYRELVDVIRRLKILLIILSINLLLYFTTSILKSNIYDGRLILFAFLAINFFVSITLSFILFKYVSKKNI